MEHSFDINIAKKFGIQAAVILKNLYFWIEKNKANDTNYYDGYYWTYNSKKAFSDLFPYMTERQIDYTLKKLIDEEIIITGNYNKMAYDRTLWYAITKKGYSILQNCEMEETKMLNGNNENVKPIPDINTNINKNINTNNIKSSAKAPDIYVIDLPTNRFNTIGENYYVTEDLFNVLVDTYQNVDVITELKKMKAWLITNTAKRKTLKGMEKFINSWLNRQQDIPKNNTNYNNKNTNWFDVIGKEEGIF